MVSGIPQVSTIPISACGCSSSSQKMQYAAQIDDIWRDCLKALRKQEMQ
jgi:hypothetical protein